MKAMVEAMKEAVERRMFVKGLVDVIVQQTMSEQHKQNLPQKVYG